MRTATFVLAFSLLVGLLPTPAMTSTRVGVYAIIDDVTFEPSDFEPERVRISGMFVVPQPISSGLHQLPSRGHLYFSLNHDAESTTRWDWEALKKAAGTGQVVGFGRYWMPCSNLRSIRLPKLSEDANCSLEVNVHTDASTATPEPYPVPSLEGVVTDFDDDLCARFGKPSVLIVYELREAYSPGIVQDEPPVCPGSVGLISNSRLDSAFDTQTRDSEWADDAEALILGRLTGAPGLTLSGLDVECRDTICHISLVFPSREYQEAEGNRLAADALNELPDFAEGGKIIPPRNEPTMDYYLQRRKAPD